MSSFSRLIRNILRGSQARRRARRVTAAYGWNLRDLAAAIGCHYNRQARQGTVAAPAQFCLDILRLLAIWARQGRQRRAQELAVVARAALEITEPADADEEGSLCLLALKQS